jgi:hypothetical protein
VASRILAQAQSAPAAEPIDQNGDVVFRFRLPAIPNPDALTLEEIYRQSIHDLLHLVRFYYRGDPVLIDEFAFLNALEMRVRIADGRAGS